MQFSRQHVNTGLGVLVMVTHTSYDWWAFTKPFSPQLWGMYIGIAFLVPACVWFVER